MSRILNLDLKIEPLENLEELDGGKGILENAIAQSTYLSENSGNKRPLQIRWKLAFEIDLAIIKNRCPNGYATFLQHLIVATTVVTHSIAGT